MKLGLTKARSVGAIAEVVKQAGGSVARVFKKAELPTNLISAPEQLILLRDQVRLLACAVSEIGDPALPARLSTTAGAAGLGLLGTRVCSSATLGEAIDRAEVETSRFLQTETWTGLARLDEHSVLYGYRIVEPLDIGRQLNEVLALGYLLDVARHFLGPGWRPERIVVTGATLQDKTEIESIFDCDVVLGQKAGIVLPSACLTALNPSSTVPIEEYLAHDMPAYGTCAAYVEHLLALGSGLGRPSIGWVSGRMGLSPRCLQRRLKEEGLTFAKVQQKVLLHKAKEMLTESDLSVSQIGFEIGYSDPAHFSRAFQSSVGMSPSEWRRANAI